MPNTHSIATATHYDDVTSPLTLPKAFSESRFDWLAKANACKPVLHRRILPVQSAVVPVEDSQAYQGWRMEKAPAASHYVAVKGKPALFDFGEHVVGHVRIRTSPGEQRPVFLRFGEAEAEVALEPSVWPRASEWLDALKVSFDDMGLGIAYPRRALRYLRIDTEEEDALIPILDVSIDQESSAATFDLAIFPDVREPWHAALDEISLRTLRNCMQDVFEDGPKRDRRSWLGDLRLEALVNYVTFRNFDLVKRCLYLHAACTDELGIVPASVGPGPWHAIARRIPDYAWLYPVILREYALASGDWETAHNLWALAFHQLALFERHRDERGLFQDPGNLWLFIDWHRELDREAAEQAVALYSMKQLALLACELGKQEEAAALEHRACEFQSLIRERLLDANGFYVSGPQRQISWASQVWMIISGVAATDEGRMILEGLLDGFDALPPVTPYMRHYVIEAMLICGMRKEAEEYLKMNWLPMVEMGATTCWEAFVPEDPMYSPYGHHVHNSYCHAWSCTPSFFIRTDFAKPQEALLRCAPMK